MMRSLRSALMLLSVGRLLGVAVAQGSGRCSRAALTGAWSSQGRTYITAPSGAQDCSTVGDGTCHATQILDYTACQIAQDACFSASGAQGDDHGYCPLSACCLPPLATRIRDFRPSTSCALLCLGKCPRMYDGTGRLCTNRHARTPLPTRDLGWAARLSRAGPCQLAIQRKRRGGERRRALACLLARRKRRP